MTFEDLEKQVTYLEQLVYQPIAKDRVGGLLEELESMHRDINGLYEAVSSLLRQVQDQGVFAIEAEEFLSILLS